MRLEFNKDTDSLYIHLTENSGKGAQEVAPEIVIDFNKDGKPIGIDIEHAQNVLDLNKLDIDSFPIKKVSFA